MTQPNSQRFVDLEPDGSVPVTIVSGGGTGGTASTFGSGFPPTGTAAGFNDASGNMAGANLDAGGNLRVSLVGGLTPKFAIIQLSATGTVVAAVSSKKIRVLSYVLMANGTVNTKWQSHVTPTDLTGLLYLIVNTGISVPFSPLGYFESLSGEALDLNLSAGIAVGGHLTYVEV